MLDFQGYTETEILETPSKDEDGTVSCRVCQDINSAWTLIWYSSKPKDDYGYRQLAGDSQEELLSYAVPRGFTHYFSGSDETSKQPLTVV